MKKAFSLLEIIIVISIITIVAGYIMFKSSNSIDSAISSKIKSDIALIRNSISKQNTKNILLNKQELFVLDNAEIEKSGEKLFENVLLHPLISTNSIEKIKGEWIKNSSDLYSVYLYDNTYLEYQYKNFNFECKSSLELCEKFQ